MNQLYILKKRENIMPKGSEQLTNARKEKNINKKLILLNKQIVVTINQKRKK